MVAMLAGSLSNIVLDYVFIFLLHLGIFGAVLATGFAAYGVVANLSLVVPSVYTGIAQGTQPILSRFYGYGDTKSVKLTLRYAIRLMLFISGG